jgi:hypothetical protein
MEGVLLKLANIHHVDHGRRLIRPSQINHVEVGGAVTLDVVGEEVVDGVLVSRSHTLQPERIGLRQVLHRSLVVGQA